MSASPFWGLPVYFYLLFMAIKVPLAVMGTFLVGLFVSMRRWRHPGYAFVLFMLFFWIVPYSLIGAKWLRYTLSLMPFVYMIAAVGIGSVMNWCSALLKKCGSQFVVHFAAIAFLMRAFVYLLACTAYADV